MKSLNSYIFEKFKINKDTNLNPLDSDVLLYTLKESKLNFKKEFIDSIKEWLDKNSFIKFKIYSRNLHYLETLKLNESTINDSREDMNKAYNIYFPEDEETQKKYRKHCDDNEDHDILINGKALYFNKYCKGHTSNGPWLEMVIIGEK